jgi:hypothetical protein
MRSPHSCPGSSESVSWRWPSASRLESALPRSPRAASDRRQCGESDDACTRSSQIPASGASDAAESSATLASALRRRPAQAAVPTASLVRRHWSSELSALRTSALARSLAARLLALGTTRARIPRIRGAPTRGASSIAPRQEQVLAHRVASVWLVRRGASRARVGGRRRRLGRVLLRSARAVVDRRSVLTGLPRVPR